MDENREHLPTIAAWHTIHISCAVKNINAVPSSLLDVISLNSLLYQLPNSNRATVPN